jgi:hypothetical protein
MNFKSLKSIEVIKNYADNATNSIKINNFDISANYMYIRSKERNI